MKKDCFLMALFFTVVLTGGLATAQDSGAGSDPSDVPGESGESGFLWSGMERALQLTEENDKTILLYVYDNTCPWCRRMREEVYANPSVEEVISRYFVPVRIDINSAQTLRYLGTSFTQSEFAKALGNEEVPTTYFMNPKGEITGSQPGFIEPELFVTLLEYVGSGAINSESFEAFRSRQ